MRRADARNASAWLGSRRGALIVLLASAGVACGDASKKDGAKPAEEDDEPKPRKKKSADAKGTAGPALAFDEGKLDELLASRKKTGMLVDADSHGTDAALAALDRQLLSMQERPKVAQRLQYEIRDLASAANTLEGDQAKRALVMAVSLLAMLETFGSDGAAAVALVAEKAEHDAVKSAAKKLQSK